MNFGTPKRNYIKKKKNTPQLCHFSALWSLASYSGPQVPHVQNQRDIVRTHDLYDFGKRVSLILVHSKCSRNVSNSSHPSLPSPCFMFQSAKLTYLGMLDYVTLSIVHSVGIFFPPSGKFTIHSPSTIKANIHLFQELAQISNALDPALTLLGRVRPLFSKVACFGFLSLFHKPP